MGRVDCAGQGSSGSIGSGSRHITGQYARYCRRSAPRCLIAFSIPASQPNGFWRRTRRRFITCQKAEDSLVLLQNTPCPYIKAKPPGRKPLILERKSGIAVYDAASVAAVQQLGCEGATADGPLFNAIGKDF